MKNSFRQIVLFGVLFLNIFGVSHAGTIRMQIKSSIDLGTGLLSIKLEVINTGDEAAREVKPSIWIGNRLQMLRGIDQLFPGKTLKIEFRTQKHPFREPGFYYLPIHLEYRDQTGSRFQLPYLVQMVHGTRNNAGLRWETSKAVLPSEDFIEVTLINTEAWSKTVYLSKIMAMQFKIELPPSPFELKGNESRTWKLNIKHDTIWPNTYVSYMIAEYSHEGQHYSHYTPLTMQVTPEAVQSLRFFGRNVMVILLISLIVVAILGGYGPLVYRRLWQKHS